MDENQIAFIVCVNDENEFNEALNYIEALKVPEGFHTDVIAIREAPSMAAGYNAAMQSSDAKYKIYIHQDVFLIYRELLEDLLALFQSDDEIGMVGVLGCRVLPLNAHSIARWDTGRTICNGVSGHFNGYEVQRMGEYSEVMAIDGMFMATQYDIAWREDLFDGWDFYDISQSCEFIRAGKRVVVPYQKEYWTAHDNRASKLKMYDVYRKKFIENYQDICPLQWENNTFKRQEEYEAVKQEALEIMIKLIDEGKMGDVCEIFAREEYQGHLILREIELICKIYMGEKQGGFYPYIYHTGMSYRDIYERFVQLRHLLQRIEFGYGDIAENFNVIEREYSVYAVSVMIIAYSYDSKKIYERILGLYKTNNDVKYRQLKKYSNIFENEREWGQALEVIKDGDKVPKQQLVIVPEVTSDIWNNYLKKYDKTGYCILSEKIDENMDIECIGHAMVLTGNVVKLVSQKQEKLYSDYFKVDVYGKLMEEYVKIYQNTPIPVVWHVEGDCQGGITYSSNITVERI